MKMQHYLDDARVDSWICPFGGNPSIKSSCKDVCSIELHEFYLGIPFSVFGITCRRSEVPKNMKNWNLAFMEEWKHEIELKMYPLDRAR